MIAAHIGSWWKIHRTHSIHSRQTKQNNLLSIYANKGIKPKKTSPLGGYFFLPTLMRYETPLHYPNSSTMQLTDYLDLWRLSDLGIGGEPLIQALIFFNEQWWFQPNNPHSAYYLLPRTHLHVIVTDTNWLSVSNTEFREWVSSFWLLDYGYIRVVSITNFDQYLVHHASNKYYDTTPHNLPKSSTIIRGLGFEYKKGHFVPRMSLNNLHFFKYTDDHNDSIASCFPLSFTPVPERPHEGIPNCFKLSNMTKID